MKKTIMALAAVCMMATVASAQDRQERGDRQGRKFDQKEMIQKRTEATVKKYDLNDEQAKKLMDLNQKYADKMGPRMGGPRNGFRGGPRMRPGRRNADGQTGATPQGGGEKRERPQLTEEQKQKMEAQRKEQAEVMKQYDAELQGIMTADQYKAYKADMEKRMKEGPRGGRRDHSE